MSTEIYLSTFGPEDETGYREHMDHYQIPAHRETWKCVYGIVRDRVGRDGLILMYKATVDENRNMISCSPTPWRVR